MAPLPVAFRSNQGKYKFIGTAELRNAFAEQLGTDAKGPLAVLPSPGLARFAINGDTPCRGLIYLPDLDVIYSVHTSSVWKVLPSGVSTNIGVILGSDIVQMSRNQKSPHPQIIIQTSGIVYVIENDVISQITDPDLPAGVISADTVGRYTVYGYQDGTYYISAIDDAMSVNALDFDSASISPDPLVRIQEDRGELFPFGTQTVENFQNTGNADFPLERQPGATIQKGLLAKDAVVKADNTLFWASDDWNVRKLASTSATQVVSTPSVARLIQNDDAQASIKGFSYIHEGHEFVNLTGSNWTRAYDCSTDQWHSRNSYGYDYWRGRFSVRAWGKTIVGDALSGQLFWLDSDTYDEDGAPLIWGVTFPPLHVDSGEFKGFRLDYVYLDVMTGAGKVPQSAQGHDPVLTFRVSRDGGNTFHINRQIRLGKSGKHMTRVYARRLGRFSEKGAVLDINVSDPVARAIVGGGVSMTPLKA